MRRKKIRTTAPVTASLTVTIRPTAFQPVARHPHPSRARAGKLARILCLFPRMNALFPLPWTATNSTTKDGFQWGTLIILIMAARAIVPAIRAAVALRCTEFRKALPS
jgi:hypothetical protein